MFKANKEMESNALYSGTGVFYQAMPAVGADGRNIMKLIPVQKVNGQFVHSQIVSTVQPQRPKTTTYSSQPIQIGNTVTLNSSTNGQFMKRQFSSPKEVGHFNGNCMKAKSAPQNLTNFVAQTQGTLTRLPQTQSVTVKNNLPVTVKSPVLPNGQYLQIPSNARVKTVPVSELPLAIKKQIVAPTTSATSSSSPTVLFVSPVQTMNLSTPALSITSATSLKSPSKSVDQTSCRPSSTGSNPVSRSGAIDSQRPKSPIKWVIEEGDGSLAPCLVPVNSPVVESNILRAVAERETTKNTHETAPPKKAPVSSSSPPKSGPKKDDALMMCNGKVYLLAKRGNILPSSPPAAKSCGGVKKASPQPLQLENVTDTPQTSHTTQNSIQIRIPDRSNEIIDLCDDDPQDDITPLVLSSMPQMDEDNVIFVSYIPPNSMLGSEKNMNNKVPTRKEATVQHLAKGPEQDGMTKLDILGPVQNMVIGRDSATISINEGCRNAQAADHRNVIFVSYNPPNSMFGSVKNRTNNVPASKLAPRQDLAKGTEQHGTRNLDKSNNQSVVVGREITSLMNESCRNTQAADNCQVGEEVQQILSGHVREPNGTGRPSENISGLDKENRDGDQKINSRHSDGSQPMECVEVHPIVLEMENVPHEDNISDSAGQSMVIGRNGATTLLNESYQNTNVADNCQAGEEAHGKRQILTGHGRESNHGKLNGNNKPCVDTSGPDMENILNGEGGKKNNSQHSATSQPMESVKVHPINVEWMELMENIQHEDSISDGTNIKLESETHNIEKSKCDHMLRQMFGITSDIRIYLEKIDDSKTGSVSKGITVIANGMTVRVLESIQESTSKLKEREHWESQDLGDPKPRNGDDSAPVENESDTTRADSLSTPNPKMVVASPTCYSTELRTAPLSAVCPGLEIKVHANQSSPKEIQCNVEFEQMFGPMEPVDEDFITSADENDIPTAQDNVTHHKRYTSVMGCLQGPCCAELSAKPKRKGKPKMCTACPCGMPLAVLAKKTHTKQKKQDLTEQEGSVMLELGKIRRKRGRPKKSSTEREEISAKAPRKVEKMTLGRNLSLSTKGKQGHTVEDIPASSNMPATSVESAINEMKMQERIDKLQDLLREKEAALEMLRKNLG